MQIESASLGSDNIDGKPFSRIERYSQIGGKSCILHLELTLDIINSIVCLAPEQELDASLRYSEDSLHARLHKFLISLSLA